MAIFIALRVKSKDYFFHYFVSKVMITSHYSKILKITVMFTFSNHYAPTQPVCNLLAYSLEFDGIP